MRTLFKVVFGLTVVGATGVFVVTKLTARLTAKAEEVIRQLDETVTDVVIEAMWEA